MFNPKLVLAFIIIALTACSSQTGRYQQRHDSTPSRLPTPAELKDAIPRAEAKSRGGNKHYQVRGKSYQVLNSAQGFSETGIASWYGNKFHGHLTSNGEIYDMYGMSAAHKNLPLPTYVKVTNLTNQRSVIVRVNDRGPFHQSRIIDLSYAAAYKIGMLKHGTAKVKIEAITDFNAHTNNQTITKTPEKTEQYIIQILATTNQQLAKSTATALANLYQKTVTTPEHQGIYRIQMGPFAKNQDLTELISSLKRAGYPQAYRRKLLQ